MKDPPAACGRPVNLQTFFRGTKLRYFEVASKNSMAVTTNTGGRAAQRPGKPAIVQELIADPPCFQLQLFMTAVQECAGSMLALQAAARNDNMTSTAYCQARSGLKGSFHTGADGDATAELLKRLHTLPYWMAEALDKPDSVEDFTAVLVAIHALAECCSMDSTSDEAQTVWQSMVWWLGTLSDHFRSLIAGKQPAALVVVAHWVVLLRRAERYYWFLKGSAARCLLA